jgi:hypothetical protein
MAAIVVEAVDPDDAVLGFKIESEIVDEFRVHTEVPGDTFDGVDVVDRVALHVGAAGARSCCKQTEACRASLAACIADEGQKLQRQHRQHAGHQIQDQAAQQRQADDADAPDLPR